MEVGNLRSVTDDDALLVLKWRNAPAVRENSYNIEEISESVHLKWWSRMMKDPRQVIYIFELESTALGVVLFSDIDKKNRRATWAFYASPTAPKGTGKRMECAALDKAFLELSLSKLCCEILDFNNAVINLHSSFGFEQEGFLIKHRFIRNEFKNVVLMAIFKETWIKNREEKIRMILGKTKKS